MPKLDGTGPMGQGAGTGRGMGSCGAGSGMDEVAVADMVSVAGDLFLPKTNYPLWRTKKKCLRKN